ncbi:MAG: hypothetical protein ACYDEJ_04220 [Desulfitobacteriaceae bacterium]
MVTLEMIHQARTTLHNLVLTKWLTEDVFSTRWWGMIAFNLFSYVLCLSLINKRRLRNILLFGSLTSVGMLAFEAIGVSFVLWYCSTPIMPIVPCIFASSITILPLNYMLVYQYTSSWKQFTIWNALVAGVFALVIDPILVHFKIFEINNWRYIYTLLAVFFIASLARAVTLWIIGIEEKHN